MASFSEQQSLAPLNTKNLPFDIEAERSVLAACVLSKDALSEIMTKLVPGDFYRQSHQIIYKAILDLNLKRLPVDIISLSDFLKGEGQLESVGGYGYLLDLTDNTYALTSWLNHTDIVKRASVLRDIIYASTKINALAYDAPSDLNQVVEEVEKTLFEATERRISSDFITIRDLLVQTMLNVEEMKNQHKSTMGIATGFADVDKLFGGFKGGDLIILAARPGVGKTSFALNLAVNAAHLGATVAFLSLEMSNLQLTQRILCSESRVDLGAFRSGKIGEQDMSALAQAAEKLGKLNLYIDDTPSLSILELRAKVRREMRDVKQGLIVVDYLQLMQGTGIRRDGNRSVEVAEISRGLKILAKEMDMPIIALSQLSRAIEQRGTSKRPMLSDLRESGAIEQDADIVMFIDRSMDEMEAESSKRPPLGTANLIVAKHRNGPTAEITLSFTARSTKFGDYYDESRL